MGGNSDDACSLRLRIKEVRNEKENEKGNEGKKLGIRKRVKKGMRGREVRNEKEYETQHRTGLINIINLPA